MTYLIIITLAPSPMPSQIPHITFSESCLTACISPIRYNLTPCGCILMSCPGNVQDSSNLSRQLNATSLYREWYLVIFPWTSFRATVCASTGDKWHSCPPTKCVALIIIECSTPSSKSTWINVMFCWFVLSLTQTLSVAIQLTVHHLPI